MAPVHLIVIITPQAGKTERILELFGACVEYVQNNEPYVHLYEMHRGTSELNAGNERLIILEGYDDEEACAKHMKCPPVLKLLQAFEEEDLGQIQGINTIAGPGINQHTS